MGATTTGAVIATGAGLLGQRKQRKAAKSAAKKQEKAAGRSAELLAEAGRESEVDLLEAGKGAATEIGLASDRAQEVLQPFAESGMNAFEQARDEILSGLPVGGAFANSVRDASTQFIKDRPEIFNLSGPVAESVEQGGQILGEGLSQDLTGQKLDVGRQGIASTADIAGIKERGLTSLADVARGTASQRASALIGSAPGLTKLNQQAGEARLLSKVASDRAQTQGLNTLAQFAGRVTA